MIEDFDLCYRAVRSRDARFDGSFFVAVSSTGIYCRPSCPAVPPKRANVRFYPSAAAAASPRSPVGGVPDLRASLERSPEIHEIDKRATRREEVVA